MNMSPEEQIARGEHAKRLLDDPLLQESMILVRETLKDAWAALPVSDTAKAEELKRCLWAANQFEAIFTSLVGGATILRAELHSRESMEAKQDAIKRRMNAT
jgi:hypothetical protein